MKRNEKFFWVGGFIFFLVGDLITTYVGIKYGFMQEAMPFHKAIYNLFGLEIMMISLTVAKTIFIIFSWFIWDYSIKVGGVFNYIKYSFPLSIMLTGLAATINNGYLILFQKSLI